MQLPHAKTGDRTAQLLRGHEAGLARSGGVLLMRHSAREFEPGRHDLLNPLTDAGRQLAARLGASLPAGLDLRGYASPVERCIETAELLIDAYGGGEQGRTRKMEGLGVFYVLDQMKMFRALQGAGGLREFVSAWVAGELAPDVVMPAATAVVTLLSGLACRVAHSAPTNGALPRLDVCVSHDLTLQLVRAVIYELDSVADPEVEFLDGLLLFAGNDGVMFATHDYAARPLNLALG